MKTRTYKLTEKSTMTNKCYDIDRYLVKQNIIFLGKDYSSYGIVQRANDKEKRDVKYEHIMGQDPVFFEMDSMKASIYMERSKLSIKYTELLLVKYPTNVLMCFNNGLMLYQVTEVYGEIKLLFTDLVDVSSDYRYSIPYLAMQEQNNG